jgi:GNAT superfamily N-acetyltransferase
MQLCLRTADDGDRTFCEDLNRRNMAQYLASRKIPWDSALFSASWVEFENLMIIEQAKVVGLLRLAVESNALAVRDLQVIPEQHGRGIGTWALHQAIGITAARGSPVVQLRGTKRALHSASTLASGSRYSLSSAAPCTWLIGCRLTIHSSRTRFACRLNSGVRWHMKYPLALATLSFIGIAGLTKVAYDLFTAEQCALSVSYALPKGSPESTAALSASTREFADKSGYKFMSSVLDGRLTIYGPTDKDRQIVIFNAKTPKQIKVSFYDCRKNGNGSATGESWMQVVGRRYLKLGAT